MPAWLLWERIKNCAKQQRERKEEEHKRWILELLIQARSLTYGLQVSGEPPPNWEQIQRQKKGKGPQKAEVDKAYKAFRDMIERHGNGISSPYAFEEYIGLAGPDGTGHVFEPPQVQLPADLKAQRQAEVAGVKSRILSKLDKFIEKHGDTPIDQVIVAQR